MDKNKFLSNISTIENQLNMLTYDEYDRSVGRDIKQNLFALVKVSESFDEYLPQINDLTFKPTDFLYSEPHAIVREHFNGTKKQLLGIIDIIKREVNFGKLDDITLVKPETITFPWLWDNLSVRNVVWLCGILISMIIFSFGLGWTLN